MEKEFVRANKTAYFRSEILIYCKALLIAIAISLVSVLIFAVFLKFIDINSTWILTINQIIKMFSILFACYVIKKKTKMNWWRGIFLGFAYAILTFFIFSLLSNSFNFDLNLAYNILFSSVIGLICGIIARV